VVVLSINSGIIFGWGCRRINDGRTGSAGKSIEGAVPADISSLMLAIVCWRVRMLSVRCWAVLFWDGVEGSDAFVDDVA
jgi:hypothetical protein